MRKNLSLASQAQLQCTCVFEQTTCTNIQTVHGKLTLARGVKVWRRVCFLVAIFAATSEAAVAIRARADLKRGTHPSSVSQHSVLILTCCNVKAQQTQSRADVTDPCKHDMLLSPTVSGGHCLSHAIRRQHATRATSYLLGAFGDLRATLRIVEIRFAACIDLVSWLAYTGQINMHTPVRLLAVHHESKFLPFYQHAHMHERADPHGAESHMCIHKHARTFVYVCIYVPLINVHACLLPIRQASKRLQMEGTSPRRSENEGQACSGHANGGCRMVGKDKPGKLPR